MSPPQHINYFTPRSLGQLFQAGGFPSPLVATEGGMNWENLFGRRIRSEIRDAYETFTSASPSAQVQPQTVGIAGRAKQLVLTTLVKPVCYQWLKLGILLYGLARRP